MNVSSCFLFYILNEFSLFVCSVHKFTTFLIQVLLFPFKEMILNDQCTEDARGKPDMFLKFKILP